MLVQIEFEVRVQARGLARELGMGKVKKLEMESV
jgi:hypothetical protein